MITPEEVKRLFELARIEASAEELAKFPAELDSILEYVAQLSSADVANVSPTLSFAAPESTFREDAAFEPLVQEQTALTDQFPDEENGYLKTKKVFGGQ